jgi:hypothetical protein
VPSGCCVTSRRVAVSSSRRPLTAQPSRRLAPAGCYVAFCPLIALPSCGLVARRLVVAWPPSNDVAALAGNVAVSDVVRSWF